MAAFVVGGGETAGAYVLNIETLATSVQKDLAERWRGLNWKSLSMEQIDEIVRFLQSRSEFDWVQVTQKSEGTYQIITKDVEKIYSVQVSGSQSYSSSDIESIFGIHTGTRFNPKAIGEGIERLKSAYADKAYYHVDLDVNDRWISGKGHQLEIRIHEGKQSRIGKIVFNSENRDLNSRLNLEFRKWHDIYNEGAISKLNTAIRLQLNRGKFLRASIQGPDAVFSADESRVDVHFTIENPYSFEFVFEGTKAITALTLESQALNLEDFYSANPNVGPELANRVRLHYLQRGYARVEVNSEEMLGKREFLRKVIFTVDEGAKVKIAKVIFGGKQSRPPDYYTEFICNHSSPLVRDRYYNKEDIDQGISNLINELRNQGFLMAKVSSMLRVQYNKEKTQVNIHINLEEGPQSLLQSLEFTGNEFFRKEKLLSIIGMPDSGPLHLNLLEDAVDKLKRFYQENGFIEMALINEKTDLITYDATNTRARVNFKISEGPQVHVASILLEGNEFSKDKLILLELEVGVGDILTPNKIDESISRLRRTGYFSAVEIHTLEEKTAISHRTLVVRVKEVDPGLFKMGAGVTNELDLTTRGYTGIAYRNIRGTGRGVSARIDGRYNVTHLRYPEYKLTLGYVEPYLFDTRVRGRINYIRDNSMVEFDIKHVTETRQTAYALEKDITSHILGIWEVLSVANYHDYSIDPGRVYENAQTDIGSTGLSFNLDYRDNAFNPTKGLLSIFNLEYGSPQLSSSKTIEYSRAQATLIYFEPFYKSKIIWGNQLRLGYLTNLQSSPQSGVPYNKKGFILGGQSTIRGFAAGTSEVFPNKEQLGGVDNYNLNSHASMYLFKSELRFPLYENFGGSLFYDRGSVKISGIDLNPSFRDAAGFGLNIGTPVGPVNLEFAWKLNQQNGESPYQFYLSMGYF